MTKKISNSLVCLLLTNIILVALDFCWFHFDHRIPSMDEAGHIMCCMSMQECLNHVRLLKPEWWHKLATVSQLYPPVYYFTGGLLRIIFKQLDWVDLLTMQLFKILLWTSTFLIARLCTLNNPASVLSVLALASFPLVSVLSHTYFLEIPLLSGVAFSLFSLLCWYENRQKKSAPLLILLSGCAIGFACLIKQPAGLFILPCAAYLTLKKEADKSAYIEKIAQAACIAAIACLLFLPWFLTNVGYFNFLVEKNVQAFHSHNSANTFSNYLIPYINAIPRSMSPLLFAACVLGVFTLDKKLQLKLLPASLTCIIGIPLLASFTASENLSRYVIPALIAPALYAGAFLADFALSNKLWKKAVAILWTLLIVVQNISFSYLPYPLGACLPSPVNKALCDFSLFTYTINSCPAGQLPVAKDNPASENDGWWQKTMIEKIRVKSKGRPVWLNVMINTGPLNARTFVYLSKISKSDIYPSTSRVWTITGDKVVYDQAEINRYDWYLFKDGNEGYLYADQASSDNADKIRSYVQNSSDFKLVAQKDLPDKTHLFLYQNIAHEK